MNYAQMRRKDRALPQEKAEELLSRCEYGVLASIGKDSQPFGTPISFVYREGAIYFHCAATGQKLNNIRANPKVCFTVVGNTQPLYDKSFSTIYESVMAFGNAICVEDDKEKTEALMQLCEKYLPGHMDKAPGEIAKMFAATTVVKIPVDYMTGKAKLQKE